VPGARAERGELLFGNIDTRLIWNLTGGPKGANCISLAGQIWYWCD
jgi:glycerol kinase